MKKKALLLYISRFSGHYRAARAIEAGFAELTEEVEVTKINALGYTNPVLGKIINRAYMEVIRKRPEIWERMYDNPEVMKRTQKAREALHRFNMAKIGRLVKKYSPDAVFCTQAFPCGMMSDYKRKFLSDVPLIGVLTDHAPHSYWLNNEVDYYVAPSVETANRLKEKGVPGERIRVYGIPVDPVFASRQDKDIALSMVGLKSGKPVVLIMGGSQGLGAVEETVLSLVSDRKRDYQLMVVTGSNTRLLKRLQKTVIQGNTDEVKLFSYVDNVDILMDAADVIVSKPGGMTTSEALVKGLPIVIVKPIPGHERMNTDYLLSKGVAIEVKDMGLLHAKLNELFDDRQKLKGMKDKALEIAHPESAVDTARLLFEAQRCSTMST